MINRAAIIGDGGMGTLSALLLTSRGLGVRMWSAFKEHVAEMQRTGRNARFLPGVSLPKDLLVSTDAAEVTDGADLVVLAVPSRYLRGVLEQVAGNLPPEAIYCSVVKGIETESLLRPSEVLEAVAGPRRTVVLSGPCLAREVAAELPAAVVVASADADDADRVRRAYATDWFRVYTSPDSVGVELGGALKNVVAIAAGICHGLDLGTNAVAALVTRGLVEVTRLGTALGARPETFAGLAGLGDLVTTCLSPLSRNHRVGEAIGRGRSLEDVLEEMGRAEPEGVRTTWAVLALAERERVEMPITREVYEVLFKGKPAPDAVADLMRREMKAETAMQ